MANNELVKKAVSGDKEALGQIIIDHKRDYYKLAYSFTFNDQDALDAISDMTLILLKKIKTLKDITKFNSYSNTILVNCCRKIIKSRIVTFYLDENLIATPEEYNEEIIDLKNSIEKLPIKYQEVIILKYFQDLDYQTISEILKIPLGTVKSRLNIGLKQLEKKMGGYVYE